MIGFKYYKISKLLKNSEYVNMNCGVCNHTKMTPKIRFPYLVSSVYWKCDKCKSKSYFDVSDILYSYRVELMANQVVKKHVKPNECIKFELDDFNLKI